MRTPTTTTAIRPASSATSRAIGKPATTRTCLEATKDLSTADCTTGKPRRVLTITLDVADARLPINDIIITTCDKPGFSGNELSKILFHYPTFLGTSVRSVCLKFSCNNDSIMNTAKYPSSAGFGPCFATHGPFFRNIPVDRFSFRRTKIRNVNLYRICSTNLARSYHE